MSRASQRSPNARACRLACSASRSRGPRPGSEQGRGSSERGARLAQVLERVPEDDRRRGRRDRRGRRRARPAAGIRCARSRRRAARARKRVEQGAVAGTHVEYLAAGAIRPGARRAGPRVPNGASAGRRNGRSPAGTSLSRPLELLVGGLRVRARRAAARALDAARRPRSPVAERRPAPIAALRRSGRRRAIRTPFRGGWCGHLRHRGEIRADRQSQPVTSSAQHGGERDHAAAGTSLAVIVPATDGPPTLERCVEAIRAAVEPPRRDRRRRPPRPGEAPRRPGTPVSPAPASDVLAFVDSDVIVRPEAFSRMRRSIRGRSRAGVRSSGHTTILPRPPTPCRASGTCSTTTCTESTAGRANTFWAGLGAVRRDAFLAVGGFDERRYPRAIDRGRRGRDRASSTRAGGVELDPGLQGKHLEADGRSPPRRGPTSRGVESPRSGLLRERGAATSDLNLGWRHRASAAASVFALVALAARRARRPPRSPRSRCFALNRSFYGLLLRRRGPAQAGRRRGAARSAPRRRRRVGCPAGLFARGVRRP